MKPSKKYILDLLKGVNDKIKDEYGVDEDVIDSRDIKRITEIALPQLEKEASPISSADTSITANKIEKLYLSWAATSAFGYYFLNTQGKIPLKMFYYDELKKSFNLEHLYSTFKKTVINHKKNLFAIVDRIAKQNKANEINRYLRSISEDYKGSLNQQLVRVFEASQKIKINNKKIVTKDVDNYTRFYDECAGSIEFYIKIIYGLEMILKNPSLRFEEVIKTKTYFIKKELKKLDSAYSILLEPFNTNIWNSIKHKQYKKYPSQNKIKFEYVEGKNINSLELSYNEFLTLTKKNFSTLSIISKFFSALELRLANEL